MSKRGSVFLPGGASRGMQFRRDGRTSQQSCSFKEWDNKHANEIANQQMQLMLSSQIYDNSVEFSMYDIFELQDIGKDDEEDSEDGNASRYRVWEGDLDHSKTIYIVAHVGIFFE